MLSQVTYQTSHGQLLDLITAPPGTVDLSRYSMDAYLRIITYKTAFYTFYLPVACGMVLAGLTSPESFELAESICIDIGRYFQVSSDQAQSLVCLNIKLNQMEASLTVTVGHQRLHLQTGRDTCMLNH